LSEINVLFVLYVLFKIKPRKPRILKNKKVKKKMKPSELQEYIEWVATNPVIPAGKTYLETYKELNKDKVKKGDLSEWW
jgi:hypothetical protein